MNITKADNLACPIDGNRLRQQEKQLVCDSGHSFDIAKQGYINLLPVQHKRSKQPGDSKKMVLARTNFLNSEIYQSIATKLYEIVLPQLTDHTDCSFLDAGCGEGYYLNYLYDALKHHEQDGNLSFIGLDISKDAIIQATKRNKGISWIVGTNRQPPVSDESVDIILCLFGFLSLAAFHKCLKSGAKLITLDPGPLHLQELREIIYSELRKEKSEDASLSENTGFSLLETRNICVKKTISGNVQIKNLLLMTPHFFRASKEGKEVASQLNELEITIDVVFKIWKKTD